MVQQLKFLSAAIRRHFSPFPILPGRTHFSKSKTAETRTVRDIRTPQQTFCKPEALPQLACRGPTVRTNYCAYACVRMSMLWGNQERKERRTRRGEEEEEEGGGDVREKNKGKGSTLRETYGWRRDRHKSWLIQSLHSCVHSYIVSRTIFLH